MKKALAAILAIVMVLSLCACGGSKAAHNDAGYYTAFSVTENGETMTQADLEELGWDVYLDLREDGTGTLAMGGDVTEFTWEDGSLTADGDTVRYVLAGGMLTLDLSDGDEFVMIFKKGAAPDEAASGKGFGRISTAKDPAADGGENEKEDAAEKPEAPTPEGGVPMGAWTPVGKALEDYYVEIVGAESFTDHDDKDAIRFYYDFTNNSDSTTSAWMALNFDAEQDGYTLVSTYAWSENDVAEYGNDDLNVQPGVTIRCIREYEFKPSGGPVTFTVSTYKDDLTGEFDDAQNLPGRPEKDWVIELIDDPQYAIDYDAEATTDRYDIAVTGAELAEGYSIDTVIRVFFDFTNKGDSETSCWWATNVYAYQDGIQLSTAYPDEDAETDSLFNTEIAPGESVSCSRCWEVRTDSPIEIVFTDWGDILCAATFYMD